MKVTSFKCDSCGAVYNSAAELIGVYKEANTLFENVRFVFKTSEVEASALHCCQKCVLEKVETPIAYLKGRDLDKWKMKRAELSKLLLYSIVRPADKPEKK